MTVRLLPRNLFKQWILGTKKLVSSVTASRISTHHSNRHGSAHCTCLNVVSLSLRAKTHFLKIWHESARWMTIRQICKKLPIPGFEPVLWVKTACPNQLDYTGWVL